MVWVNWWLKCLELKSKHSKLNTWFLFSKVLHLQVSAVHFEKYIFLGREDRFLNYCNETGMMMMMMTTMTMTTTSHNCFQLAAPRSGPLRLQEQLQTGVLPFSMLIRELLPLYQPLENPEIKCRGHQLAPFGPAIITSQLHMWQFTQHYPLCLVLQFCFWRSV